MPKRIMICRRIVSLLLVLVLSVLLSINRTVDAEQYLGCASAYALIEANSGIVIKKNNMDSRLPMASTTKTMTALVVIENCELDAIIAVPDEAVGVEGSSMYLSRGEQISVRDLLYGLMLCSGNDAAVALAIHVGGSVDKFVAMMNARAEKMGLCDTHFVTPNGLHDQNHYTTAYELAKIGAEAMKNETFREIVSAKYHSTTTGTTERTMKNKNTLLWNYDGAVGIKTGYTMAAGRCLLFAAERDGLLLVGAVLNCKPMFEAAEQMLDYGFANYAMCTVVQSGSRIARCFVPDGQKNILALTAKSDIMIPVLKGTEMSVEVRVDLLKGVSAPINVGDRMGKARFYSSGELIGETELLADENIAVRDLAFYLELLLKSMLS